MKPATVIGDKHRLYQMFFNIIDNAIKYTPNGGNVWIRMDVQAELAVVTIGDDGIGITEEDLPHIFERFFRVDKDRARKTGGSGLGLAICKLIAEMHDGEIHVSSKAGTGTMFSLSFECTKSL
jgi:signal transduction histidine kinase